MMMMAMAMAVRWLSLPVGLIRKSPTAHERGRGMEPAERRMGVRGVVIVITDFRQKNGRQKG